MGVKDHNAARPRRGSDTIAARPLNGAEVRGPHADEPVFFDNVAEFIFAEHVGPKVW